jgi:hypothetical protein
VIRTCGTCVDNSGSYASATCGRRKDLSCTWEDNIEVNLKRVHRHELLLLTQGEIRGLVKVTMDVWVPPFFLEVLVVITAAQQANLECRL